jgi:phosphopantothenoylcysteine decarboxylase / phosphopantothenate---cysteine ligase
MEVLRHKKVLLGVTGGIAAYKSPELVRLLVKAGAEVKVVMTAAALDFVTAKVLSVVSKNTVYIDFFDKDNNWNNHVHLAEWADVMLVAPLTANTLAKMATGACDNLLLATWLSARSKVIVAPAMDLDMYVHPTVKKNLETLSSFGNTIIPAERGELASGLHGEGRMAEPLSIVEGLVAFFRQNLPLAGKTALVNAGPTYEPIDPVRFIGNYSSGRMGVAIAERLLKLGASVTLVLGPSQVHPAPGIEVVNVQTASQMLHEMTSRFEGKHYVICSAAVADYSPVSTSETKLKKSAEELHLKLQPTADVLAVLGKNKTTQCLVGFALESGDLEANATEKLKRKNLDIIVANAASGEYRAIGGDQSRITIIDKRNKMVNFEFKEKTAIAEDIVNYIMSYTAG